MTAALTLIDHNLHEVRVDERRMLFHIPTTSLFEIDGLGGELIDLFRQRHQMRAEDIQACFSERYSPEAVVETLKEMVELEIIADGTVHESGGMLKETAPIRIENFPLSTVVLNVNTGCNLSCSYCYKEDLAKPSEGQKMAFATAKKSIELLLQESPHRSRYNIVFFGGEPLTNMPLIRQVVDFAEPHFAARGKSVDFSLTTNATMLTQELVDYFNAHRFGITVSIDGPKALHDKNRITVGGQGTYGVVAEKSRMLLDTYTARPIGARVTMTRGVTDVVGIWDHLFNDLGFHEVGFAPVTSGDLAYYNLSDKEMATVFTGMKTLGQRYLDAALRHENIGFGNMHQLMTDLHEGTHKSLPCGAGVGMLAVDKSGGLNLCHRFTGSDLPVFGSVDHGIDKSRLSRFIEARTDRSNTGCQTCRIRNLCSGGCYHESYARYNDPAHPTYHYCDLMRDWVDFGIDVYSRILAANPDYFSTYLAPRRSLPEGYSSRAANGVTNHETL